MTENLAVYQSNEQTSFGNKEVEPTEPFQMKIYQSIEIYLRKDLSWLNFDYESRAQEKPDE